PGLPPELEREIFEIAARNHPATIPVLVRIAKRVNVIFHHCVAQGGHRIEPMLYRVLCVAWELGNPSRIPLAALRSAMDVKPAAFFHDHVRHLQFMGYFPVEDIIKILSVCKNTINLSLSGRSIRDARTLLPFLGVLPLQRLSATLGRLFATGTDFSHPLFSQITHIDVPTMPWEVAGFALLPRLTHLSFPFPHLANFNCAHALRECRSLRVLVL
ncbi:hypothetical protein FB451DRAFT_964776, partial [Mycena latifolia]